MENSFSMNSSASTDFASLVDDVRLESVDAVRFYRSYRAHNKKDENKIFKSENTWQRTNYHKLNLEKSHYKKFFYTRRLPVRENMFQENLFYFHDHSFSFEENGNGDYYLYGLYAGMPHIMMMDKEAYFSNENEFMKLSVERFLSHKNSLLSSASTTQIVSRIDKNSAIPSVLNLLRPKDPLIRRRMLERHGVSTTIKKDHNKEAMKPFTASVNFPPQYPIEFNDAKPFPKSLKELSLKQQRREIMIAPYRKRPPVIGKAQVFTQPSNFHTTFPKRQHTNILRVDAWTQTTGEHLFQDIIQKFRSEDRLVMNESKEWHQKLIDNKRLPLQNYQYALFYLAPPTKPKPKGFYDLQPKVESPWLTKMIKNGKFTRKYYLENFKMSPVVTKVPGKKTIHDTSSHHVLAHTSEKGTRRNSNKTK